MHTVRCRTIWRNSDLYPLLHPATLFGEAAESDRPAGRIHPGDAVLPFVPRRARQMIDGPRSEQRGGAIETAGSAPAKSQRRRCSKRDAEDMLEDRAVAVPAKPRTRIVADQ